MKPRKTCDGDWHGVPLGVSAVISVKSVPPKEDGATGAVLGIFHGP
jgi:hypothetical protein